MRLIDADKLKVYLQEYLHYGHAIPWLDAQPTAYDVDAVVKELEEESDFFGGEPMGSLQKAYYCKGVEKAIDIIKAGGVK